MKKYAIILVLLFTAFSNMYYVSYAGDLANDTVWTKRTDQSQGFFSLQFIKNDAVVVGQAVGYTIFYDAFNGNEINRILGSNKAIFFNGEKNFLRLNNDRKRVEIFDTESYEVIGELESDDLSVGSLVISKDENLVVGVVTNGLRVWDLQTKKILRTRTQELNESLIGITIYDLAILSNQGILAFVVKDYKLEDNPLPVSTKRNILYDFETLDSVANWGYKGYLFQISPTQKYIAYGYNGVEIYNLETGELVSTLKLNSDALTGIEFSNNESFIVTSSTTFDDLLAIWDVKTGKQLYEYPSGSNACFDLSKDNKFIIKSSGGRTLSKYKVTEQMTSINDDRNNTILYPNPTNNSLLIKYNVNKPNIFQYEISNLTGHSVINNNIGFKNIGENIETIDVGNLPIGQYNLLLYSQTEQFNFKFIKGE